MISPKKIKRLKKILTDCRSVLIAYSGGKDSFFLLRTALSALDRDQVHPCFAVTPFISENSRRRIAASKRLLGINIFELPLNLLQDAAIARNRQQRCYRCKRRMFSALKKEARRLGCGCVMDGSTTSDLLQFRPGRRALEQLQIRSPLLEAGISSPEIAAHLHRQGFKPDFLLATTCLATRFPYDHDLKIEEIARIAAVENFLLKKRIMPLRVRYMENGVRIETAPRNFARVIALRPALLILCHSLGYRNVTLDIEGFRSGSWDITPAPLSFHFDDKSINPGGQYPFFPGAKVM